MGLKLENLFSLAFENWTYKFVALLVALVLWLTVTVKDRHKEFKARSETQHNRIEKDE